MRDIKGKDQISHWIGIGMAIAAIMGVMVLASGCTSTGSQGASRGDMVKVTYRMAFPGGPVFESNENSTPLVFVVGSGQMITGFENAVLGMNLGQTKTVIIPPEQAYGVRNESLVGEINSEYLGAILGELEKRGQFTRLKYPGIEGVIFHYQLPDNTVVYYRFTNITDENTTVDQNHPLAGRQLEATITLLEIMK